MRSYVGKLLALAALCAAAVAIAACGSSDSSSSETSAAEPPPGSEGQASAQSLEGKTVGYLQAGPEYYYQCQGKGVQQRVEELGGTVITLNSDSNPQKQLANGQDLIARGVDVLLIESTDSSTGRKVIDLASEAGIPTVIAGLPVPGAKADGTVLTDYEQMGAEMGTWLTENRPDAKIGLVQGLPGQGVTEAISAGFESTLAPTVEVVADQPADWSRQKAGAVAQNMMQANPEIELIYVFNEDMAVGVYQALRESGDDVELVSNNGSEEGIELLDSGALVATVAQSASGEGILSADEAAKVLAEGPQSQVVKYPLKVITKETQDTVEYPFCL